MTGVSFTTENSRDPGIVTTATATPQLTISTGVVLVLQHPTGFQRLLMSLKIECKHEDEKSSHLHIVSCNEKIKS